MSKILEVQNVSKHFHLHVQNDKRIPALDDVTFDMERGEILGLTGKSGSGKSSLMKCIYRTYLVSSGRILLHLEDGSTVDLAAAGEHEVLRVRRTEMFYCSQFLSVIPRVPAVDVVAESLTRKGRSQDEARTIARELLSRLGLPQELWDAFPATFSGGEQQRVNIARAIIAAPRFLLVDEPTASLDQKTKDVVIDLVLALKNRGTSVVLITHDQHTLERMADRRLHLLHGRVREMATA
ncbi:ATP-binding cassette domain-containing protein [Opitutales bacterium ASA1]|uniref:phosphonate C-P lyase system protein PhnL n=1 Tax=Congregicoccus parvus TaxID=3081749 RepID=UPI002B2E83B9|nr:ATP-binding cassette domain-containing protein [Opitutales bacterium ASA1]